MKSRLTGLEMAMVLVATASFYQVAGGWRWLVAVAGVAVLGSWWLGWRYASDSSQQRVIHALAGTPFLVAGGSRLLSRDPAVQVATEFAVIAACYVLLGVVIEVFRRAEDARPTVLHTATVTVMIVAGIFIAWTDSLRFRGISSSTPGRPP